VPSSGGARRDDSLHEFPVRADPPDAQTTPDDLAERADAHHGIVAERR
jgi:hypothetical protein